MCIAFILPGRVSESTLWAVWRGSCDFFNAKKATVGNKATQIEKQCDLDHGVEKYCSQEIIDAFTFYETPEGFVIPKNAADTFGISYEFADEEESKAIEKSFEDKKKIDTEMVDFSLNALGVDKIGLDPTDREILKAIIEKFKGGPVGLNTLAAAVSEEEETIEDIYEPFLMKLGFLERTPRGRLVTDRAYSHLGLDTIKS